jgi:hypothetical protein
MFASNADAQARPDFSGRWVDAAVAASAAAGRGARGARGGQGRGGRGSLGSGWGSDITITQNTDRLTLQYELFGRGDMQPPIIYHYALDGSESRSRLLLGWGVEERVSHARWDGITLVITTVFASPDPATGAPATSEMTQVLSLESPTSLVVETTRPGVMGGASTTTRTTYTKM